MFTKLYEKIKYFIKENYKGLIVLFLVFLLFMIELPYSIYTPGGAVNLNERIEVHDKNKVRGSFNMAYVSMVKGSIPFLILSHVFPDWDIVKKEDITNEGESMDELLERERLYLEESIDSAVINAYQKAGKDITITSVNNTVSYITDKANTNLKIGDHIIAIDHQPIESFSQLKEYVETLEEGREVTLQIKREGKEKNVTAITYQVEGYTKIGVSLISTYSYDANPTVSVKSKSSEAGSSGGLMMSLTIYNQLVEKDITKGLKIVGTGTIDIQGNVGEIGGVKYKLIGAVKNKADVFICPEENYEEAKNIAKDKKYSIKIISAKTFDEVLEKLEEL